MNILFDAEDFKNQARGIAKTTLSLYCACRDLDPSLRITGLARKPMEVDVPAGIDITCMKPDFRRGLWRFLMFNRYLLSHDCTAVHFPANGMIPLLINGKKQAVVMTLHDVLPLVVPGHFSSLAGEWRYRRKKQKDIDRTDVLFTVSEYSKREITKNFRVHTEPVVLYNAPTLNPESFDPGAYKGRTEDYFLYFGGYDKRKGLAQLVRTFLRLHERKSIKSMLYLAGSICDLSPELNGLIREASERGIVRELGYVPDAELVALMKRAKALVYPSKYEGFGLPPIEAMNLGCPVITTPFSSLREVCGDAALYADPDDDKGFAEAVTALETNEKLRMRLIADGKKHVEKYSWAGTAALFLETIGKLQSR